MTYDEILNDNHGIFHKSRLTMDGKVLDDYPENVEFNNMANDSSGIELGTTYASALTLEIRNVSAEILNQEVFVEDGARDPDGNFIWKPLGYFMAVSSFHDRGITKYTMYDRMAYKLAGQYVTSLTFPTTDKAVIEEICTRCGVKLIGTLTAHTIDTAPSGTNKDVLGYMLQLQGKNAVFNENGDLELKWYEDKGYTIDDSQIYMEGDASTTAAFTIGYIKNTRSVKKTETKYEEQTEYDDEGNASVKNVPYTEESTEEQTYVAGDGLQGIVFANPYMTQAIVNELYEKLKNFSYTPATFHFVGDYRIRAMDIVTVTTDGGKEYKVPVMAIDHSSDGGLASTVYSYGVSESSGSMDSGSSNSRAMERYDADLAYLKAVYANTMNAERAKILFLQTKELQAEVGKFGYVKSDKLEATVADLGYVKTKELDAEVAELGYTKTKELEAEVSKFGYAKADELDVVSENVEKLTGDYSSFKESAVEHFTANDAEIEDLKTKKLDAVDADLKYANIDFSNIGKAAMEYFYSQSGLIKNVTIGDATITGEIVGVTFRGDLIIGNTIVADKLVIKGEDGLYYKLNTDGVVTEKDQTDYNSLNGQIIRAKSVTAEKIAVDDLVAFGATIGGFHITLHSIFSGVKESATNTTRGIFLGDDGQFAFGDGNDYVKYYRDQNGTYKLAISASEITISAGKNLADAVDDLEKKMDDVRYVTGTEVRYQAGTSGTTAPTGTWQISVPVVPAGQYLWTRTTTKYNFGDDVVSYSVGATGSKGEKGDPGGTGDTGNGISSIIEYYAVSSSNTTAPTSWVTTPPQMTDVNKYLWSYRVYSYTNGTTTETRKCVIGVYGDSGTVGAGGNLVKNGFGEYLDNTNFSDGGGVFTRGDCPDGCYGYFTNGVTGYMPFDPTKVYDLEFWIRASKEATAGSRNYFSIVPYDVDGNLIGYYNVTNYNLNLFYLSEDLNPGDAVVHFTDLSKWFTGTSATWQRSMLFFGYTDNTGYTYPDGTYSRYVYLNVYANDSSVDKTNNTIALSKVWAGRSYKKGTCVAQTTDESTYCYYGQVGNIYGVNEWSKRKAQVYAGTKEKPADRRLLYTKKIKIFLYNNAADYAGISLKEQTGVGIVKTEVTYAVSTSGTTAPTSGWQTNPPTAVADQYMWTRTVYTYTDSTTSTSYSVAKNGSDGATGKDGSKTVIAKVSYSGNDYYAGYSEAAISNKIANSMSDHFAVSSSDNISIGDIALCKCIASDTKRVTYMMLKVTSKSSTAIDGTVIGQTNGLTGAAGRGIQSTAVTYQAGASGTTVPTGTWVSSPPATTAAMPYMWTRIVYTYTDSTTSTSYSVGATPEGIEVGGRNLLQKYINAAGRCTKISDTSVKIGTEVGDTYFKLKAYSDLKKGEIYTISCDAANVPDGCNWSFGVTTQAAAWQLYLNKNGRCYATGTPASDVTAGSEFIVDDLNGRPATAPNIVLSNFKLEKGNKATDWTPAPEDVDSAIDSAQNTADSAQSSANAAQSTANNAQSTADDAKKKIEFIVASGSSSSSITLTDAAVAAITKQFKVTGSDGSTTIIEGGKLKVDDLSAITGKFTGTVYANAIKVKEKVVEYTNVGAHYLIIEQEHSTSYGRIRLGGKYEGSSSYYYGLECYINTGTASDVESSTVILSGDDVYIGKSSSEAYVLVQPSFGGVTIHGDLDAEYVSLSGSLHLANNTWNLIGDDVYIGDHNVGGCLCIKSAYANAATGIQFYNNQETHAASITYNSANWEFKSNTGITAYLGGTQYGQFRAAGNGKSVIHRWDGSQYYILFSDSETGGWNSVRPLTINTGGGVSFGHDIWVGGQLYLSGNYYLKCPDGKSRIIACVTSVGNFHFGSDGYDGSYGATYYSGNTLYVRAKTHLYRNLSWEQGSDARLKHGICEIPDRYLDAYMDIEPVQFLWNDKPTLGRQSGVIAQQVLEALCKNGVSNEEVNIVSMTEDTEMYGFRTYMVNYEFLNVLTMAAVQRQEKKIKELEDQLSKLKA